MNADRLVYSQAAVSNLINAWDIRCTMLEDALNWAAKLDPRVKNIAESAIRQSHDKFNEVMKNGTTGNS